MGTAMNTMQTKPRRERPKAMKLSDAAAARIREIIAAADGKYAGVRVGVTNGVDNEACGLERVGYPSQSRIKFLDEVQIHLPARAV